MSITKKMNSTIREKEEKKEINNTKGRVSDLSYFQRHCRLFGLEGSSSGLDRIFRILNNAQSVLGGVHRYCAIIGGDRQGDHLGGHSGENAKVSPSSLLSLLRLVSSAQDQLNGLKSQHRLTLSSGSVGCFDGVNPVVQDAVEASGNGRVKNEDDGVELATMPPFTFSG